MSEPVEPRRPAWRHPFLLAFVAGCLLVTLAAPRFRRIAPPPDRTGTLAAWSLEDQSGQPFGSSQQRGHVALVGLVSGHAPDASLQVARALVDLSPRFDMARADVALLLIDLDGRTPRARSEWLARAVPDPRQILCLGAGPSDGAAACALALEAFGTTGEAGDCEAARALAPDGRLALVDADGGLRGTYGSVGEGLFEAFERTLRTCDAATTGPVR